jgi:hypothetical protein
LTLRQIKPGNAGFFYGKHSDAELITVLKGLAPFALSLSKGAKLCLGEYFDAEPASLSEKQFS